MASQMYDYLCERYCAGKLTDAQLDASVRKGWITAEEAQMIREEKARRDAAALEAAAAEPAAAEPAAAE